MGNPFSRGGCISLKGHAQVSAVAFLPDGELVTAGGSTVRAWNLETGRAEKVWRFPGAVETCCCSPDGRYIACGVVDGLVFVYEARTWQQVAHWQAHADCGQGPLLQFFADSTYLLSAAEFSCKIWSRPTTKLINTWDTTLITSLHIAEDCTLLAVGSSTGLVTVHTLPDGCGVHQMQAHRGEVWAVAFSPDGSLLATASRDEPEAVKLWVADGWELLQALKGHQGAVFDCAFSPSSGQLVTCGADRSLRVWRRSRAGAARERREPERGALPAAVPPAAPAAQWAEPWRCENILLGHTDTVLSCSFAPSSFPGLVASGALDGAARAWRLSDVPQITAADAVAHGLAWP